VPRVRRTTQVELPLGLETYRNTSLFSDHYLEERLPEMAWYGRDGRAGRSRQAYDSIRELFELRRPEETLANAPEAQCEEDIVRPVLSALGYEYLIQTPTGGGSAPKNFPDFALFGSAEDKESARPEVLTGDYSRALALAEGKYWNRDLDRKRITAQDYLTNGNPSFQIVNYLIQSGRRWGILTNGRLWRLYCRDAPQPLDRYFEIDLPQLINQGGAAAFLHYFWGVFSAEALRPGAGGQAHVDRIRLGSADYAADVGDELRSQVFNALLCLAAGLVKGREEPIDEATLDEIYDNSLVALYRLLFVFYAEARELLPLESSQSYYETLSLTALVRDVGDKRERRIAFSSTATSMWDRLSALWRAIDVGDDDLAVTAYDGELFASGGHPFLDEHKIADAYLADALELIGYVTRDGAPQTVDYRSLSVAHLGTVYEGLLDNKLRIDPDRLGPVEDRVMLASVSGRRRETGSYYTPDPVVQFIVREALAPLIEGKDEDEIMRLRVVDPAMGSGHFLVAAVEFLALAIATHPERQNDDGDDDLSEIKRRVAERCIWGVDLNPLAVELSKLSLWLATASADKPLTFLDNRLRCGNSVMSLRPDELRLGGAGDDQVTILEEALRERREADLAVVAELEQTDADSMEGVERRKDLFRRLDASRDRLRRICNAAVGLIRGGVEVDQLERLISSLGADAQTWEEALEPIATGPAAAFDDRPFHWELEFPEVFDKGGFDVVLGNPPYVNAWEMTQFDETLRGALAALPRWRKVAKGHWDLFVLFVALGQQLLVSNGIFGIIVANPIMRERYAESLRAGLLEGQFLKIIDFGEENVFEGVARETVVLIWRNAEPGPDHLVEVVDPRAVLSAA
jgi:hypothetical protein